MKSKIYIVAGEFHREISEVMVHAVKENAYDLGMEIIDVIWIPGAFEAPFVIKEIFETKKCEGVVLLGYVEKGETMHGEVIGKTVAAKLLDLQLEYRKPIGFGMIGPGATQEQAKARMENSAKGAINAVAKMCQFKNEINK